MIFVFMFTGRTGMFFISRDVSKVFFFIYICFYEYSDNFLFYLKLKEVTTEALKGAESTRTNLRRLEESSDF